MSVPAPVPLDASRATLAALEAEVAARERDLSTFKLELQELQSRYLAELGGLYADLYALEAAVAEEEVRLGLRPPSLPDADEAEDDDPEADAPDDPAACASRGTPSTSLKRIFRDVARAVHPDRARDERTKYRRHSLMAEANRAYAERDEDRLRLILRAWEHGTDDLIPEGADADEQRVSRRLALLGDHLIALEAEFADLRGSAIAGLKRRIDETATQGWDLFAELVRTVKRDISRMSARLAKLRRSSPNAPTLD